MKTTRSLLWAALLHEDEALTERQVGGMVTMENISTVLDELTTALNDATPDSDAAAPEEPPADPI